MLNALEISQLKTQAAKTATKLQVTNTEFLGWRTPRWIHAERQLQYRLVILVTGPCLCFGDPNRAFPVHKTRLHSFNGERVVTGRPVTPIVFRLVAVPAGDAELGRLGREVVEGGEQCSAVQGGGPLEPVPCPDPANRPGVLGEVATGVTKLLNYRDLGFILTRAKEVGALVDEVDEAGAAVELGEEDGGVGLGLGGVDPMKAGS
nr:hypothetical protein TorRG33x02_097470 [Ipomoea batatas]